MQGRVLPGGEKNAGAAWTGERADGKRPGYFIYNGLDRMRLIRWILILVLAAPLFGGQVMAQDYRAGALAISEAWAPAGLGKQKIGAAYFTIRNHGEAPDRLLAIELPAGGTAMLHESLMQDGVMRMRPVETPEIPAKGELMLRPGGLHVMLTDLPSPLIAGERLRLRLQFAVAGETEIEAEVKPRSATQPHQGH